MIFGGYYKASEILRLGAFRTGNEKPGKCRSITSSYLKYLDVGFHTGGAVSTSVSELCSAY